MTNVNDMNDLHHLLDNGADSAHHSKSSGKRRTSGNQRKTRQQQFKNDYEAAKTAIKLGDIATLSQIVETKEQANWHGTDVGWCLLDEAVKTGSLTMVKWLLDAGANPNTIFFNDKPLVASRGLPEGMFFSPLASAIKSGMVEIVALFQERGAMFDLPVWNLGDGDCMTCQDLVMEGDMFAQLVALHESRAIAVETPEAPSSDAGNRTLRI
jgi:hypothetical protein